MKFKEPDVLAMLMYSHLFPDTSWARFQKRGVIGRGSRLGGVLTLGSMKLHRTKQETPRPHLNDSSFGIYVCRHLAPD